MIVLEKIYTPVRSAFDIIFFPEKAFKRIDKKPDWIGVFIFLGIFFTIIKLLNSIVVRKMLASSLPKEIIISAFKTFKEKQLYLNLFQLSQFYVEILLFSFFCWMVIRILFFNANFKKIWLLILQCEIILFFENILLTLILFLRSGDHFSTLNEFRINIGLGFLLKGGEITYLLLNSINVVSIWWIVILTNGLVTTIGISKRKKIPVGIIVFILFVLIRLYMFHLGTYIREYIIYY